MSCTNKVQCFYDRLWSGTKHHFRTTVSKQKQAEWQSRQGVFEDKKRIE